MFHVDPLRQRGQFHLWRAVEAHALPAGQLDLDADDVRREGFPDMTPDEFRTFWLEGHRNNPTRDGHDMCRRIEWKYEAM